MYIKLQTNLLKINISIYFFIIFFPQNFGTYFDGLPFLSFFDSFYLLIIFPITLIFFLDFFKKKWVLVILNILLVLKLILVFSPMNGVDLQQFSSEENLEKKNYIKTFDSFWNGKSSFLQKKNFNNKFEFPIDWRTVKHHEDDLLPSYGNIIKNKVSILNKDHITKLKPIENYDDFKNLQLFYHINFYLNNDSESIFFIEALGCEKSNLYFLDLNNLNKKNFKCNQSVKLDKGLFLVSGDLKFSGEDWSLKYILKKNQNKNHSNLFFKNIFYQNPISSLLKPWHLNIISNIFSILLLLFFLLILSINILNKKKFQISFFYSIIFFIVFIFFNNLVYPTLNLNKFDPYGSSSISFSLIFFLIVIFFNKNNLLLNLNLKYFFFIILSPSILFFFWNKFSTEIYQSNSYFTQDDWSLFEYYSRQIVVDNQWLIAGEPIFYMRPGIRYFYSLYHILFGKSLFVFGMVETWIVIFAGYGISQTLRNLKINYFIYISAGVLFLFFSFGDNIRYLIGKGLSEFHCLLFFAIFIIFVNFLKFNYKSLILLSLIATIGVWLREEHLLIYLVLIFSFVTKSTNFTQKNNFFVIFFNFMIINYKKIIFYWLCVFIGFSTIFLRNYFAGGEFAFLKLSIIDQSNNPILTLSRVFFGSDPEFGFSIPRIYSLFLIGSFLISIFCLFKQNIKYLNNLIFLPLCNFAIIFPYTFLINAAYPPRYIIHYLFFSIIICSIFLYNLLMINKKNKLSKNLGF